MLSLDILAIETTCHVK